MQFTKIVLLFAAALSVSATPGPAELSKRTCGTLTGTPLKICQEACKVTCDLATGGIVRKLCKAACDHGPLAARDTEAVAVGADATQASGSNDAADAAKEVFDLQDLDLDALDIEARDVEARDNKVDKRNWKHKLCDIACDITCNSTISLSTRRSA